MLFTAFAYYQSIADFPSSDRDRLSTMIVAFSLLGREGGKCCGDKEMRPAGILSSPIIPVSIANVSQRSRNPAVQELKKGVSWKPVGLDNKKIAPRGRGSTMKRYNQVCDKRT